MGQTLIEDCLYNLTPKENESRRVYFVKLTDSCLKALEEHVTYKVSTSTKPSIKFDGQNGVFQIPSKPGSANQDISKKFNFVLSQLKTTNGNPSQGILECIVHKRKSNELLSYGELDQKICVAASDDSYEQTRNRMAQVDQERKDVSTKEIKFESKAKKGKKLKSRVIAPDLRAKMAVVKKGSLQSTLKSSAALTNKHASSPAHKTSSSIKPTSNAAQLVKSVPKTHQHQIGKNTKMFSSAPGKSFSCRDRVIHVLAIRPYKKPELVTRLQREGMSQKDRNNLAMVLKQVSSLLDNSHKLSTHLYNDVKVNSWPFYTENEKLIVKRNMAMNKPTDTLSPQVVSSTSKSPEEKTRGLKRPLVTSNPSLKRSSEVNEEPTSTSSVSSSQSRTQANNARENKKSRYEEESPPTVASTSDTPEHLVNYKPIISYEQRCQYKRDFQAEYPEYIELKKNVDAITTKFIELDRSWRRQEKGSPEYLRIQDEIMEAYNKQQEDEKYNEVKRRCESLHQKLSHIKRLVVEFDLSTQA